MAKPFQSDYVIISFVDIMPLRFRRSRNQICVIITLIIVVYALTCIFPSVAPYLTPVQYDAEPLQLKQEFHPDKNSLLIVTACSGNHFMYLNYMLYSLKKLNVWVIFYDIGKEQYD